MKDKQQIGHNENNKKLRQQNLYHFFIQILISIKTYIKLTGREREGTSGVHTSYN